MPSWRTREPDEVPICVDFVSGVPSQGIGIGCAAIQDPRPIARHLPIRNALVRRRRTGSPQAGQASCRRRRADYGRDERRVHIQLLPVPPLGLEPRTFELKDVLLQAFCVHLRVFGFAEML